MYYYRRLKDLREDSDKMQKEIAAVLGIDQKVYSIYETGKRGIPVHLLIELANYYKISIDYLLGRTNNPNIKNEPHSQLRMGFCCALKYCQDLIS